MLHPERLWVAVVLLLFLGLAATRKSAWHWSFVFRVLAVLLLVLALSDPVRKDSSTERKLVALFDVSNSISLDGRRALLDSLNPYISKNSDTVIKLYPFGERLAKTSIDISTNASTEDLLDLIADSVKSLHPGETNIGKSIQTVLSQSRSSSILLLSDGMETTGNARLAAKNAKAKGVKVFPVIPAEKAFTAKNVVISSLHAPLTVEAGDRSEIRTSVKNNYDTAVDRRLEVWFENQKLYSNTLRIPAGQEKLALVETPPTKGGLHRIRAVLKDPSAAREEGAVKDEQHRWISAKSKSKILIINGAKDDGRILGRLLSRKGYATQDIVADGETAVPVKLKHFSSVILNNAARRQLPDGFLEALRKFAKKGGGVLLIGGDRSFGLGGYINTPLEEISPLKFVPPRTKKRRLNSAVQLVIDKSRSMVYEGKIQAAKQAALTAIASLKDDDYVGVVGFDRTPFVIIRLARVADVKPIAERRLRNLVAAGSTNLLPALAAARAGLRNAKASRKHIIVLSDGKVPLAGLDYFGEVRRIRSAGISLSTVALGIEADVPFMKELANGGKGAFYHTLDPSRLPEIFLHDIKVSVGEQTMKELSEFPIGVGPGGLISSNVTAFPVLKGFVETRPKKNSRLELITRDWAEHPSQAGNFPILASWKYGEGKIIAFTSDANGRWSAPWVKWSGFAAFWSQIIDIVKSKPGIKTGQIDFDLRYSINRGAVLLDLAIFDDKLSTKASPQISAEVIEPGGEVSRVVFDPTAKGRFASALQNARQGDYKVNILYGKIKLPPLALTISREAFEEKPGTGINVQNLSDIAILTGALLNPAPEDISGVTRISKSKKHLFPVLLLATFVLVMLEAFSRELVPELFAGKNNNMRPHDRLKGVYQAGGPASRLVKKKAFLGR